MKKGKLIVLEGLNGCGKTTQANTLCNELPALYFHEVGTPRTSEFPVHLKKLLHSDYLDPVTEQFFITGSRAFNLHSIPELLDEGYNIVSDRWVYSSHVYSNRDGTFQPNVTDAIWGLHDIIKQDIVPAVTIIFDISLEEQERRLSYRGTKDKYEDVSKELLEYRRNFYLALGTVHSKCHIVNAENPEWVVYNHMRNILRVYGI